MTMKDTASALLKRLEEGTGEIYARYRDLAQATDAQYQSRLTSLDADYANAANALAGRSKVGLRENLTGLADLGLQNSGAAQQVRIASNTSLMNSLGQLSTQRAKERGEIEAERTTTAQSLAKEGEEKAQSYRTGMYQMLLQQLNADRDYELEQEKLALQKQSAQRDYDLKPKQWQASVSKSSTKSSSGSGSGSTDGVTLSQTPAKLLETLQQANRKYNEDGKYYYVDRTNLQKKLDQILKDNRISEVYRYQLYAQARALGYVK